MSESTEVVAYWDPSNPTVIQHQIDQVVELRLAGHSVRQIAAATGMSRSTVHRREHQGIAQLPVLANADELRKVEVARLDRYLAALDQRVQAGDVNAIQAALRVSDRRSKLLGLDAPIQVEGTFTEVTQEDLELAEMMREAQARVRAQEDALRGGDGS